MARPDLGKKLNYVVDFWSDGCDGPLTVYFEAAYPALLHAALSYYCPDPVNIFTGWARPATLPKGLRSGSHARGARSAAKRKGFWSRFRKVFGFQPDEWLAKKMPFADEMEGRQVPGGVNWMWAGYGAIERFNNFMFMYAIAEDFLYEFSAGVARSVYCQNQQAAVFLGKSDRISHFALLDETPAVINDVLKQRRVFWNGGNGLMPDTPTFNANFSCGKISRWDGGSDISSCRLVMRMPDGQRVVMPVSEAGVNVMVHGKTTVPGMVFFFFEGDHSFFADDCQFSVFGYQGVPSIRPEGWCNDVVEGAINWSEAR